METFVASHNQQPNVATGTNHKKENRKLVSGRDFSFTYRMNKLICVCDKLGI